MSFNKIIIVGNLGRDPELRYTPQGTAVCSFSLASNEKKKDKAGEWQSVATWFRITLWGKQGENAAKYLTKGAPVYIEGRLRLEKYIDRDGVQQAALEVNGTDMQFIGAREGGGSVDRSADYDQTRQSAPSNDFPSHSGPDAPASSAPAPPPLSPSVIDPDDIPF